MERNQTTGKLRITELVRVCPSGQTAGSKKTPLQIPPCQAAIFQAFESTYGTAPRFDASLHTSWLKVALTTGVTMLWDGKWFCMAMLERWGKYAVLSVLPDKIARFLYECHDTSYISLGLPPIPLDRSGICVHGILRPDQVHLYDICIICKICTICKYM